MLPSKKGGIFYDSLWIFKLICTLTGAKFCSERQKQNFRRVLFSVLGN